MKYLLGADFGTTSLKMMVFDENGNEVKSISKDYSLETNGDRVELDPEIYWRIFSEGLAEIKKFCDIFALCIDTQCETVIVADDCGNPLHKAIVWLDNRAKKQAEIIERDFGAQKVYEVTGQPEVTATWPACKLLWIRENQPEIFSRIRKIFLLEDYLLYRLTGRYVTQKTLQSSSLYFDIRTGMWWKEMLDYIGVDESMLPELRQSGDFIGYYDGMAVIAGTIDQIAGAIGAGAVRAGIVSEMTGTAMAVYLPSATIPTYNSVSKIPCHYNYDNKYCLLSWTPTAGMALKWFKENFCEDLSYRDLDKLAETITPGCEGLTFLPYLCGSTMPKYNPDACGVFFGFTLHHTRAHAIRSIMEAISCILRKNIELLYKDCDEIRFAGGGSNSAVWCQIKADMTQKKIITLQNAQTACLGSAIMAGVGAGIYNSIDTACENLVRTGYIYEPSGADYSAVYKRFYVLEELLFSSLF